jgi:thiamine-monophosphate kinase
VDEFELIERYFAGHDRGPGVVVGIGDDGAVLQPEAGRELVTVVDAVVAGVHFPIDIDAADLGYRAVAVNLSDIAAMGARPRWMTLSLTLPAADPDWLQAFATGLYEAAAEHDVALVGGDTTRGKEIVVSVQITGDVEAGKAILRSGAAEGDTIYVTGTVGDRAAGLALIQRGQHAAGLCEAFLRPRARVHVGRALVGVASAAIDISDGLVADLGKLLAASHVGGRLDLDALPLSAALLEHFDRDAALDFALAGGDDYELCFTAAGELPAAGDLPVTPIGKVTAADGLVLFDRNGPVVFEDGGYRHFG